MSKFNPKSTVKTRTKNLAGGDAYKQGMELEFLSILLTSFAQDQFYRSNNETFDRIRSLMSAIPDKKFLAKSAIFARNEFGMRSITHFAAAILAAYDYTQGQEWGKNFFDRIVRRPDDMLEILSCYWKEKETEKSLAKAMKVGFRQALSRLSPYEIAKYRGETRGLKLVDLIRITHAAPTTKNREAFEKLIKGELKSEETWEAKLTQAGQQAEDEEQKEELKAQAWKDLINENKLGTFALLRNLRNIIAAVDDKTLDTALAQLKNREAIKKSLVLPFRFKTAYNELEKNGGTKPKVLKAVSEAVDLSLDNVPEFPGSTLVVLDESGSMAGGYGNNKCPAEIGSLFAAILCKKSAADFIMFSDTARYVSYNPADSTLTLASKFRGNMKCAGTDFHNIFRVANKAYDRVIILSDMQGWMEAGTPTRTFTTYKKKYDANPKIYSFDLQGYGSLQFPEKDVFCLAGFSDKIFDIMKILETDLNALVHKIQALEL